MPDVTFKRNELSKMEIRYNVIRDCVEQQVKENGTTYLPQPNAADTSKENKERYEAYRTRAVFYNVTARTLGGMVGEVFSRDPVMELPSQLDVVKDDASGSGIDIIQQAKEGVKLTLGYGRCGLFTDYPSNEGPTTIAQQQRGDIRATIVLYKPESIINWRTLKRGAKHLLSLVVLAETYQKEDAEGFGVTEEKQYRVLRLSGPPGNETYQIQVWREGLAPGAPAESIEAPVTVEAPKDKFYPHFTFNPTNASGQALTEIPFTFIGSVNNDEQIDAPPIYDLAVLNIAHYRNSADYEESCFIVGQPTPWFSGLTEQWVKDVLKGQIQLGSRAAVPLPPEGEAGLLQVEPNSMPKEAMEHKEAQMVSLGARLVEKSKVQKTATEASFDEASESSILGSVSKNVSKAFLFALQWCAEFMGVDDSKIKFELNSDFSIANMSAEERAQTISEWQAGALAFDEVRAVLRKSGVATMDDKEAKQKIDEEMASSPAFATNPASDTAKENAEAERELQREKNKKKTGASA